MANKFCLKMPDFHVTFRDLLHALNLRRGTNGFTSLLKEGMLRVFSPWKIRWLRPGLNPRTWVPKASTLPLDHWCRHLRPYFHFNAQNSLPQNPIVHHKNPVHSLNTILLRFIFILSSHLCLELPRQLAFSFWQKMYTCPIIPICPYIEQNVDLVKL